MKNIKKSFIVLVCLMVLLSISACSASKQNQEATASAEETASASTATVTVQPSATEEPTQTPSGLLPEDAISSDAGQIAELPITKDHEDGRYAGIIRGVYDIEGKNAVEFDEVTDNTSGEGKINDSTMIIYLPLSDAVVFQLKDSEDETSDIDSFKAALGDDSVYYIITLADGTINRVEYGGKVTTITQ